MRLKLTIAAFTLIAAYLIADLVYERRPVVRSLSAHWSITGDVPWGEAARHEDGEIPVVLWLPVRGGYCFDAVFSQDLRNRLAVVQASTVEVDYSLFSNLWGRPLRHTVRAVNGIQVDRFGSDGGMILDPGNDGAAGMTTDCEAWFANQ